MIALSANAPFLAEGKKVEGKNRDLRLLSPPPHHTGEHPDTRCRNAASGPALSGGKTVVWIKRRSWKTRVDV